MGSPMLWLLASIAGLFPDLRLPLSVGWKEVHVFDLTFGAAIAFAAWKGAFRRPDPGLIASAGVFLGALTLALWAHPSPEGLRSVVRLSYSVVVLLVVSHLRLNRLSLRVDRLILGPLLLAVGIAALVFMAENLLGWDIADNRSPMLPKDVHRLGGFTGGNALILFLALAAPFVRSPRTALFGILLPAFATLSRSLLGVGAAFLVRDLGDLGSGRPGDRAVRVAAGMGVAASLFIYFFAVIPISASERATHRLSLETGGYLTPHRGAIRMVLSSPLLGIGPSRFPSLFQQFTSEEERNLLPLANRRDCDPHSALLGLAAEGGLLALAAFAWLLVEIFRRLGEIADARFRAASRAGLIGLLLGGHFVDWLALKGLWLWIGFLMAARQTRTAPTAAAEGESS